MPIPLTTEASLDFVTLQQTITEEESNVVVRLTNLIGKTENSVNFNAHTYESVDDNNLPLSKLFPIAKDGKAEADPNVKAWLQQKPTQKIKCENEVYVSNSLTKIAVVR